MYLGTSVQGFNFDFCSEESELFWSEQQEEICGAMEPDSQGGAPFCQEYLIIV